MAELATIARPYAEALFKVSRADLAAIHSWMDGLAAVAGSEQLLQFAANPKAGADQVYQLVSGVLGKPLPERGANFLRTVIDNDRLAALPELRQLCSVSGEFDYLALLRAESTARLDRLLYEIGAIDGVTRTTTSVVLARRIDRI